MKHISEKFLLGAVLLVLLVPCGNGADENGINNTTVSPQSNIVTVKTGTFRVDLDLTGMLVPTHVGPIVLEQEEWTDLTITEVVAHGTHVRKGDILIAFDTRKLDQTIADIKASEPLLQLAIRRAELDLKLHGRTAELAIEESKRKLELARQDVNVYKDIDRPRETLKTEGTVRKAIDGLLYQREELAQLKKMYREDDLTEETEEIILTRQKHTVRNQQDAVKEWESYKQKQFTVDIPRKAEQLESAVHKQDLSHSKVLATQPMDREQKELTLQQKLHDALKRQERLARLERDREGLPVRASEDGIVYYGRFFRADWITTEADKFLKPGAKPPQQVPLMTLVRARPIEAHVWLKELDALNAADIKKGWLEVSAFPRKRFPAVLKSIPDVPTAKGWYLTRFKTDIDNGLTRIVPGLLCKVIVTPYEREEAILILSAIRRDDGNDTVILLMHDGRHEKRPVTIGRVQGKRTEILEGLTPGDRILEKRDN